MSAGPGRAGSAGARGAGDAATSDRRLATFERALIVVLLAVMAGAVFLDALHRLFAAEEGRLERLLVALAPAALEALVRAVRWRPRCWRWSPSCFGYFALKARRPAGCSRRRLADRRRRRSPPALALATRLLVWLLPNGLVWSQQMALCFMLWVALAGASLGAREQAHIAFELAGKLWPAPAAPPGGAGWPG